MFNIKDYQVFLNSLDQSDIGNNSKSLFLEGLTCYMAGAYRASLIVTYTGFCSVLIDRFNQLDRETFEDKSRERKEIDDFRESITPENVLINKLVLGKKSPFFPVGYNQKEQLSYFRTVRNTCAHGNVDEIVASSHVESFFIFVQKNLMTIYPNGTVSSLLEKLSKLNVLDHKNRECKEILENCKRIFSYLGEADRLKFFEEVTNRESSISPQVSQEFISLLFQTEENIYTVVNQLKEKHFLLLLKLLNLGDVQSTEKYFEVTEMGTLFEKNYNALVKYTHSNKYYSDFDWEVIQVFVDIFSDYELIQASSDYNKIARYAIETLLVNKKVHESKPISEKWEMILKTFDSSIHEIFASLYSNYIVPLYNYKYNGNTKKTDSFDITMEPGDYNMILLFAYYLKELDWRVNKDIGLEFLTRLEKTYQCTNEDYRRLISLQKELAIREEEIAALKEKYTCTTE